MPYPVWPRGQLAPRYKPSSDFRLTRKSLGQAAHVGQVPHPALKPADYITVPEANALPQQLPEILGDFLTRHPDAGVVALSEPGYLAAGEIHPALVGRPAPPPMSDLSGEGRLAVLSCLRRARDQGTAHQVVEIDGAEVHLSTVAMIGTPLIVLVSHPTQGIGPLSASVSSEQVSTLSGSLDAEFRIDDIDGEVRPFADQSAADLVGRQFTDIVDDASFGTTIDCILEAKTLGASSCDIQLRIPSHGQMYRLTILRSQDVLNFSMVERSSIVHSADLEDRSQMNNFADSSHHGFFRVSATGELLYKNARLDELFDRCFQTLEDFGSLNTIGGARLVDVVTDELRVGSECIIDVKVDTSESPRMIRLRVHRTVGLDDRPEYSGSAEDITEILARETKLEQEALTDPMTGVANRRGLESRVDQLLTASSFSPFALLLCDLDGFKQVNDSLGHEAGDTVIQEVGHRLAAISRDADLVARLGGDEFVVVAPNMTDYDEAMEFAERILPQLRQPYHLGDTQIELSGSVGVALASEAMPTHSLLQMADHAMYEAKRAGRNQAVAYHTPDSTTTISPLALRRDLRRAITHNGLDLAFQPIYAIDNLEHAESAEVLLRWDHPIQGHIEPSTMVTIAEQSGLIRDLGEWIITESIKTAASVNADADRPISIAVNVSALQVGRPDFVDMVAANLDLHDLAPASLTIELTESYLIDRMEHARESIDALTDFGVRLAIDDFGTGYSSFEYLLTLPVYAVKIDPSFTRRLTQPRGSAMLRGLSRACRELDMLVVAEGIETIEQLQAAREAGVTHAQGYLLGMPVSTSSLGMRANSAAPRVA